MTNKFKSITIESEEIKTSGLSRSELMIEWIKAHKGEINSYQDGNIQFSFTHSALKVKDEKYEKII